MNNDIIKLLNLEQFNLKIEKINIAKVKNILNCYITISKEDIACPVCGYSKCNIKDYRPKKIQHSISTNNPCFIIYNARRYKCTCCGNIFYERNPFSKTFDKTSTYTIVSVLNKLKSHTKTFTDVATDMFLSTTTVIKIFDQYVDFKRPPLPEVICFDEVYLSRKSNYKYAFVMADFINCKLLDIYYSRHKDRLSQYFYKIKASERNNVHYIVIDMWDTYRDLATIYFPKALIVVDSFHVIKHLNEAIISIRIKIMKKYDNKNDSLETNDIYYYMLKKFHYFFIKEYDDIYDGKIKIPKLKTKWHKDEIRKYLLSIDEDLKYAYYLKERYREFSLTAKYDTCDNEFNELINEFQNSHLEEFRDFGLLIARWKPYIKNSFIRVNGKRLSNGPMEGINSRIKTIIKGTINIGVLKNFINDSLYFSIFFPF